MRWIDISKVVFEKLILSIAFTAVLICVPLSELHANDSQWGASPVKKDRTVQIVGREKTTVTTPLVKLGDIADVTSAYVIDDDTVIALQKIEIESSPQPGKSKTITASQILDRLRAENVDLDEIGYALPRVITVSRASRELTLAEIKAAVDRYLGNLDREVSLKRLEYNDVMHVMPGPISLDTESYSNEGQGRMGFRMKIRNEEGYDTHFQVTGVVDEFVEFPVANRPISRGSIVSPDDVRMARMNIGGIPRDAARDISSIVGLEANRDVSYGDVFRSNRLTIPPVITAGSKVTLLYRSALFEASATGVAIESGLLGEDIKIRNDSSRKIVTGTVLEPGLVGVAQ